MKKIFFVITGLLTGVTAMGRDYNLKGKAAAPRPVSFIENKGQWTTEARFKAELTEGALFLTDKGFVYNFVSKKDLESIHELYESGKGEQTGDAMIRHHAYRVNFEGANTAVSYEKNLKRSYYHNYFNSKNAAAWAGNVGLYGQVLQKNVYNGIDVSLSGTSQSVKYDFVVAAGADPAQIRLSFEGVKPVLTKSGDLKVVTSVNEIIEKAPYSYQVIEGRQAEVKTSYQIKDGMLSFAFPEGYNKAYPLVIDPELIFATYSGGTSASNYSYSTTYDATGHLYAGAQAYGTGWPTTAGAFQVAFAASQDVAVNKYTPDGINLVYSTYYGGASVDLPHAMMVNEQDELIIVGTSTSADLPVTTGCYDNSYNGARDIFLAHFNNNGTALIGATYIGSASVAEPNTFSWTGTSTSVISQNTTSPLELNIDDAGNIWVVGNTPSSTFPVTANALQATSGGAMDAILFKMDPTCATLMYSTYLGGSGNDAGFGIKFQSNGNIVICGGTESNNFPVTPGALHTTYGGGTFDGFAAVISPAGVLQRATYLGTSGTDLAVNLDVDCADNVYILGRTNGNYPITPGVYSMPNTDVFIDKLSSTLNSSLLSTRIGYQTSGTTRCFPTGFVLDICGNVYVSTLTSSGSQSASVPGMPLTPDAFSTTPDNFYFLALEAGFNDLLFATYFGHPNSDDHTHVGVNRMDKQGIVYQSICCAGSGWPTEPANVYCIDKTNTGQDIISFKFNFDAINIDLKEQSTEGGMDTSAHCVRGCKSAFIDFSRVGELDSALTIHYLISGTAVNGVDYQAIADSIVIPANQSDATLEIKPLLIPNPTGVKEVIIEALSPCGCEDGTSNVVKTARVKIYDSLHVEMLTPWDTVCPNTAIAFEAEIDSTLNYQWVPPALNQDTLLINTTAFGTKRYYITVSQPGAPATCPPRTAIYEIFVEPVPQISFNPKEITACLMPGDSLDLNAYVGPQGTNYNYQWSPAAYLRDDHSLNNKFAAPVGDYVRKLVASTPVANCTNEDSIKIHIVPPFSFSAIYPSDTTVHYGDSVKLDTESDAIYWIWSPVTYLDDPLAKDPLARPLETTLYQVVGIDQYGCRDTADVLINVDFKSKANIPNAFSPNGDGNNDVFKIANREFEKMTEFKVFNRWGQLVYDGKDPDKGWDGSFKGQPAAMDTYHYLIRLIYPDATEKVFKGDVLLIR